jgi:hypothetical protein
MLDIDGRPALRVPAIPPQMSGVQFYSIELTPLPDGQYFVGLTATLVDESDFAFVNQSIASDRVRSLDEALELISERVRSAAKSTGLSFEQDQTPPRFRNFYQCPACERHWTDEWSAQCDDDCPRCGKRHISPYKSEDVESGNE